MVMIHWLVEDGPFEEDITPLLEEIKKQGHNLRTVKYEPFQSGEYSHLYPEDACVIFYGSINLATQLQRQTPWIPGPMVTFENYKCSTYYAYWGKYLLNQDYNMMPYAEVCRRQKDSLFIRPDDGRKTFGGHVVRKKDFDIKGGPVGHLARPETLVITSTPKNLYHEWRVVVADRKPIAASHYMWCNNLEISEGAPPEVWEKAQEIAESTEWQPDRMYVLDICNWGNGEYFESPHYQLHLLEANSFACCGFYGCNPEPIVKEASRIALEEWQQHYE